MIPSLRYTLVGDGPSDSALMPLLRWTLLRTGTSLPLLPNWADPHLIWAESGGLAARLQNALELYPCDLLFVHRDAERQDPEMRREEIENALSRFSAPPPALHVVPVRMTEAWLLIDEAAIRSAAGNPKGSVRLTLPPIKDLEDLPDPKQTLNELLRTACELHGRRLARFNQREAVRRVADCVNDFSPLLRLPAFQRLQEETHRLLAAQGWLRAAQDFSPRTPNRFTDTFPARRTNAT